MCFVWVSEQTVIISLHSIYRLVIQRERERETERWEMQINF